MDITEEQSSLIELVERDYQVTSATAASSQTAVVASRSVGFTLIAALLGLGVIHTEWLLMLLAAVSGLAVYLVDGFYTWRTTERDNYLKRLESVMAAHYNVLLRSPNNDRDVARLERRLAALRIGATTEIKHFKWRNLRFIQPVPLFQFLYPILLLSSLVLAVVFGVQDLPSGSEHPDCPHNPRSQLITDQPTGACGGWWRAPV